MANCMRNQLSAMLSFYDLYFLLQWHFYVELSQWYFLMAYGIWGIESLHHHQSSWDFDITTKMTLLSLWVGKSPHMILIHECWTVGVGVGVGVGGGWKTVFAISQSQAYHLQLSQKWKLQLFSLVHFLPQIQHRRRFPGRAQVSTQVSVFGRKRDDKKAAHSSYSSSYSQWTRFSST